MMAIEYESGQTLVIQFVPEHSADPIDIELCVIRPITPFTLSVVCVVRPMKADPKVQLPDTCVLKLYDRRYLLNERECYDKEEGYTAAKEAAYQQYLRDPRSKDDQRDYYDVRSEKDAGAFEGWLEKFCAEMFNDKVRAYSALSDLQGTDVPRFFGSVTYSSRVPLPPKVGSSTEDRMSSGENGMPGCSNTSAPPRDDVLYIARGILIEYIPSVTLDTFLASALRTDPPHYEGMSRACDAAMEVMDRLADYPVLNKDCRLENMLVHAPETSANLDHALPRPVSNLRCVPIDWANTRLRYHDETDEQWRRAKENEEEREAVGVVAAHKLCMAADEPNSIIDRSRLWVFPQDERWWRKLTAEEQVLYEDEPMWGLYPEKKH